ncbi:MAG: hypothetical protein J7647_27530 [Cyanobacteria bacterium SBLK]|nr:hypothetical protein [Cyanobacteria bacterium SBLK]
MRDALQKLNEALDQIIQEDNPALHFTPAECSQGCPTRIEGGFAIEGRDEIILVSEGPTVLSESRPPSDSDRFISVENLTGAESVCIKVEGGEELAIDLGLKETEFIPKGQRFHIEIRAPQEIHCSLHLYHAPESFVRRSRLQ